LERAGTGMSGTQESSRTARPATPFLNPKAVQFRSTMGPYPAFRYLIAFGAALLLTSCVGEPKTYYEAEPIVLQRRAATRVSKKPAPTLSAPTSATVLSAPVQSAPVLSTDEKQQLFQDFEASQGRKDPVVIAPGAAP
jgi:hypothetical protein